MGEAKERAKLGPTRSVHIWRQEKADLAGYFAAPSRAGAAGWTAKSKEDRRQLRSALEQMGVWDFWRIAAGKGHSSEKVELDEVDVHLVSVDAISWVLSQLGAMTGLEAMALTDFEDRLNSAREGLYEIPAEVVARMAEIAAANGSREPNGVGEAPPETPGPAPARD